MAKKKINLTITRNQYSVSRSRGDVTAVLTWPSEFEDWWQLPSTLRNEVRDHLDAAIDLITDEMQRG